MEILDVRTMLLMLASASGASAAMSFITERFWPGWVLLPAQRKSLVHLAGSLLIGLLAFGLVHLADTYPEVMQSLLPWLQVVAAIVVPWIANQVAHAADPEADPDRRAKKVLKELAKKGEALMTPEERQLG